MMPESGDRAEQIAVLARYGYIVKAPEYNKNALRGRMPLTDCEHYSLSNRCDCLTHLWCKATECSFYKRRKDGE